jgi:hypothetical protein
VKGGGRGPSVGVGAAISYGWSPGSDLHVSFLAEKSAVHPSSESKDSSPTIPTPPHPTPPHPTPPHPTPPRPADHCPRALQRRRVSLLRRHQGGLPAGGQGAEAHAAKPGVREGAVSARANIPPREGRVRGGMVRYAKSLVPWTYHSSIHLFMVISALLSVLLAGRSPISAFSRIYC